MFALFAVSVMALAFLFWPGQAFPASLIGLIALFPWMTLWLVVTWPLRPLLLLVLRGEARPFADIIPLFGLATAVIANTAWLAFALSQN
ncbi:MAG: hypothetical protein B7Y86_08420 [Brevundimonas subvibrioides]|uniref:Uncharacterized protein n=1 Tax=Brevundimonas subvibrioides TaxID=74313 RepID=A0A258HKE9_9CAUL|nr:MAG: hypothetical protein B7Y86_08420 [Brevundimonas subvibrioides]